MIDPLGYLEFLHLLSCARLVLTDSGGIQKETTALGVPCLTLRENTERPVTVTEGTNRIVGQDPNRILRAVELILSGRIKRAKFQNSGMDTRRIELSRFSCALTPSPEPQLLSINKRRHDLLKLELQVFLDDCR